MKTRPRFVSRKMQARSWRAAAALLLGSSAGLLAGCNQAGDADAEAGGGHEAHAGHALASEDPHAAHRAMLEEGQDTHTDEAEVRLSEAPMLDQAGAVRSLRDDVAGNRILVVDFIFTSCQTICPVTTSLLVRAREQLSDVPGTNLAFVSMSIDANTDTPERLKAFAERHRADWTFLTGEKGVMDRALNEMDAYSTNPEDHAPMILVGDATTGRFVRLFGLPDPDRVELEVRTYLARREVAKTTCTTENDAAGYN